MVRAETTMLAKQTSPRVWALAIGLSATLALIASLFRVQNYDVWWHLRTGKLIVETRAIPRLDPFSFAASGRKWVYSGWLTEMLPTVV